MKNPLKENLKILAINDASGKANKHVEDLKSNLKISSLSSDPNLYWFSSLNPISPLPPTSHSAHPLFPVPSLDSLLFSPLLLFKHTPFTKQCPFIMSYIRGKDDDQVCWPHSFKLGQDQLCIMSLTTIYGEGNGNHSRILAWEIPWMEEPGRLQSIELQRVGYDWETKEQQMQCQPSACTRQGPDGAHLSGRNPSKPRILN